jgi:preprotein translocase subunit SecE
MQKLTTFLKESWSEMRYKVTWPTYSKLQNSSILVLVGTVIFALVIFVIDLAFDNATEWFYNAF